MVEPQKRSRLAPVLALWLAAAAVGCSGIKVRQRAALDRPSAAATAPAATTPAPADSTTLVLAGDAHARRRPDVAIEFYRDAALKALPFALSGPIAVAPDLAGETGPQAVYRRAVESAVLTAHRAARAHGEPWTDVLARAGIAVRGKVHVYDPENWASALPARLFEVEGLRRRTSRNGLGAALVLGRPHRDDPRPDEHYFPPDMFRAATALLRPGDQPGDPPAVLELHDPVLEPDMLWTAAPGVRPAPLAYDLTAALARQLSDKKFGLAGMIGVLNPALFESRAGLYMMDPYQPGKIPVVFVHGLASSPEAWAQALNELRGDPEVRRRFQFWIFFYSTGNPITASAARFRAAMDEVRKRYDPGGRDPAFNQTVVIGHSMGGLLARFAVSSSGWNLWNLVAKVPPEQLNLRPELKEILVKAAIFEPVRSVRRVVFVATPHRGSPLGYEFVGRLISALIRVPRTLTEVGKAMAQLAGSDQLSPMFRDRRQMTGVAQLASNNPMLRALNAMPISRNVAYHSIIGFNGKGSPTTGGDGVVPYESAHIEGALSELVVSSDHSAQQKEPAVVEIHRILTEHLRAYDAARKALARGLPAPAPRTRPDGPTPVRFDLTPSPDATPIARAAEPLKALGAAH